MFALLQSCCSYLSIYPCMLLSIQKNTSRITQCNFKTLPFKGNNKTTPRETQTLSNIYVAHGGCTILQAQTSLKPKKNLDITMQMLFVRMLYMHMVQTWLWANVGHPQSDHYCTSLPLCIVNSLCTNTCNPRPIN